MYILHIIDLHLRSILCIECLKCKWEAVVNSTNEGIISSGCSRIKAAFQDWLLALRPPPTAQC